MIHNDHFDNYRLGFTVSFFCYLALDSDMMFSWLLLTFSFSCECVDLHKSSPLPIISVGEIFMKMQIYVCELIVSINKYIVCVCACVWY